MDVYDTAGEFVSGATTSGAGTYSVAGLADGTYFVQIFNNLGYINELYNNISCPGFCEPTTGTPVVVSGGGTTGGIDFALAVGARVSGTIRDADTLAPLAGISVSILNLAGNSIAFGDTDAAGNYTTSNGVPSGNYLVRTNNSLGYVNELHNNVPCVSSCTLTLGTQVTLTAGSITPGINFDLGLGGRVSGTVRDAGTLLPLADVSVTLLNAGGQTVANGFTDAAGNYTTFSGVPAGNYFVRARNSQGYIDELYDNVRCSGSCDVLTSATAVTVTAGAITSGINFDLDAGARIGGTVVDAGSVPIPDVRVAILDAAGTEVTFANTDASGVYLSRAGLPSGTYFARISNSAGYVNQIYAGIPCTNFCSTATATPIAVTAPLTTGGINFTLTLGGRVSGTIRDAATLAPLASVGVDIVSATGSFLTSGNTDSSGNYTTGAGLPTGTYFARTRNSQGYINELFDDLPCVGTCTAAAGAPITVTAGSITPGVNFDLTRGGRIAGTVTAAGTGTPIANVNVDILNATGTFLTSGTTDSTGNYVSRDGLPAGSYFARTGNSQGFLNQRYNGVACNGIQCPLTGGTAIAAALGTTTSGINFVLSPGGRVSGTLTDAATSQPLVNATVTVADAGGFTITTGRTDALGNYLTGAGAAAGSYFVRTFNDLGYVDELFDNVVCPRGSCAETGGTTVAVPASGTTGGINFALGVGGRITGTVRDAATLVPLVNVQVSISDASGITVGSGTTNSLGQYAVGGLLAGTYKARTSNSLGYINELYNNLPCFPSCQTAAGAPILVSAGATTPGIDFDLDAGARITGTVTAASSGLPLAGVNVSILNAAGSTIASANTDLAGNYLSGSGLLAGTYFVRTRNSQGFINELYNDVQCVGNCVLATGNPVTVPATGTVSGIDFALDAGGRVSGVVTDATATPLANVNVNIFDASGRSVTSGTTDALGSYVARDGLPTGTYFARTFNSDGYIDELFDNKTCLGSCPITQGTPFTVTVGGMTSGIDFSLNAGARISGTVRDAGTTLPIPSVSVLLWDSSGRFVASAFTNVSGNYTTDTGVPAGTYFASTRNGAGYINELFGGATCLGNCLVTVGTPIVLPATGTTGGIDFDLSPGGRIAGAVTNAATANPLASITVSIFDSTGRFVTSGFTDFFGNYTSRDGLTTGSYFARTNNGQGFVDQLHQTPAPVPCLGCDVTTGAPIAVTAGSITSPVSFALTLGGRLAGTVTRASDGTPIPNLRISLMDGTGATVTSALTDGLGHYVTSSGVPTGTYFARTQNSQGFVDEFWNDHPCVSSCAVSDGDPIVLTAGFITGGFDFALVLDGDGDGDGIANTIDRNAGSGADESAVSSNDFSDVPLSGTTAGTITSRGGFAVTVGDISPGVQAQVAGAGTAATFEACATGGPEGLTLDAAGEIATIFCDGTTGSTTVRAIEATPVIELRDPPTGPGVVVLLTTGQAATIGSPVEADPSNTESIRILLVDGAGATLGSFDLDPGESVDATVAADGTVDATVVAGTVTVTVGGESVTLNPGESHTFPGNDDPAAAILAIQQQVDAFLAAGQIRNRGVARSINQSLEQARREIARGRNHLARLHLVVAVMKVQVFTAVRLVTPAARDTLVPAILDVMASL